MEKHIFYSFDGTSMTLPVTPKSYKLEFGMTSTVMDVCGLGEIAFPGNQTAPSLVLEVLLPAQKYPFCADWRSPSDVLSWLRKQVEQKQRVRYVITEALEEGIFFIRSVQYGEQDGTGDVYAKITLQKAPLLPAAQTVQTPGFREQTLRQSFAAQKYVVQENENLWTICRAVYHDDDLADALARYNGMENDCLSPGTTIYLPPEDRLR